jgi:fructosamine-3-kinase
MISSYNNDNLLDSMSKDLCKALHCSTTTAIKPSLMWKESHNNLSGGSGASTGIIIDKNTKNEYFIKRIYGLSGYQMLLSEYHGSLEIYNTNTIKIPKPICIGMNSINNYDESYLIYEKIKFGGSCNPIDMAEKLYNMHNFYSSNGMFGWKMNNTCGSTIQINTYTSSWSEFWDLYRLGHILSLAKLDGAVFPREVQLRQKVKQILSAHDCKPSLVHGDLWSGNQGCTTNGEPIIFDPSVFVSE